MKRKIVARNKKARHNFQVLEVYEAGIALRGDEVKSLREGKCSIQESFARIQKGEVILYNMHIPEFQQAGVFKSEPKRERKLLLHRREISRLSGLVAQKGYTLVPLEVYFNEKNMVKVELAVVKGRKLYDKRRKLKEEITKREIARQMKAHHFR